MYVLKKDRAGSFFFLCVGFFVDYTATFQLYWWRKTSGAPPCIIPGMSGHLSRTTDVS